MSGAEQPVLGIIAGSGRLPGQLAAACKSSGRPCFIIAIEGITDSTTYAGIDHAVVRIGAVGEALDHMRRANVKDMVIAGKVQRPSISSLRPDKMGARLMAHIGKAFFLGDDALLKTIVSFFEAEGFRVVGSDQVLVGLVVPQGVLGAITPDARAKADIAHGLTIANTLGELDVGQAVIVENGYVLGVEAAEGTDALITRCSALKRETKAGVLVKVKKPRQESRVDLPTIGIMTVEKIHEAGFIGIAIEADGGLILDKDEVIRRADGLGIFIVGARHE